jgi:hypothetical protein
VSASIVVFILFLISLALFPVINMLVSSANAVGLPASMLVSRSLKHLVFSFKQMTLTYFQDFLTSVLH